MDKKIAFIIGGGILAIIAVVVIIVMNSGSSTTTNTGPKGPVVLNVWKTFDDSEKFDQLFEEYRKKYPNVQVVYTKKNLENYKQDLLSAIASGNGPDIFSIHNSWLPEYVNLITPAPTTVFNLKDYKNAFVDTVVSDFTADGKIYGTAMSVDSLALYYNKDLLGSAGIATPPKTWQELEEDVNKIKKSDGKGYFSRSGVAMGMNKNVNRAVDILYLLMLQQGAVPFNQDKTQPMFAQNLDRNGEMVNPGLKALEFYTSFANPSSLNYNWNARSDYSVDAFANGRAAFLYSYSYMRQTLLAKNPNLNFDVASVPQLNLDNPSVNFANYWGEVVSKQSKNQAVAWDLLKFITSKSLLDKYYTDTKKPSSRKDLVELQASDPEIGVFATANLTAKSFYRPLQQAVDEIFAKMMDKILLNGFDAEQVLSEASQQVETLSREVSQ